jgi:CRP/FNR family cyclic AMP-dependent transcriptional regulator
VTAGPDGIEHALAATVLLSTAATSTLTRLAAASRIRTMRRDEVLFTAGSRANAVFVVVRGTLRVFTTSANGTEPTLAILTPGDLVGELGVLDEVARAASVAALRPSDVVEVPARAFRDAYDTDPAIPRRLVSLLSARMRALNDGFTDLASLDLGGRLASCSVAHAKP